MDGAFFLTNRFLVAMKWVHSNIAAEYIVLTVIIRGRIIMHRGYSETKVPNCFRVDISNLY